MSMLVDLTKNTWPIHIETVKSNCSKLLNLAWPARD